WTTRRASGATTSASPPGRAPTAPPCRASASPAR
ncbi:MAG: hypothetical protein AVDCRST_MAG35-3004, partial [uncultured Quadrisphaera sp.]